MRKRTANKADVKRAHQRIGNPKGSTGERIAAARDALDISQEALAQIIGMSRPTLSKIELDQRSPRGDALALIAKALHKRPKDLMGKDTTVPPTQNLLPLEATSSPIKRKRALHEDEDESADETGPLHGAMRMRKIREDRKLTIKALSSLSGVPFSAIHGYEQGTSGLTQVLADKIADALGVAVHRILARSAALHIEESQETMSQRWTRLQNEANISNTELASQMGISESSVNRIRGGRMDGMTLMTAWNASMMFSRALGRPISIEYLACLDGQTLENKVVPIRPNAPAPQALTAEADPRILALEHVAQEHHSSLEEMNARIGGMAEKLDSLLTFLRANATQARPAEPTLKPGHKKQ